MKNLKSYFDFNKQNRNGILLLIVLILFIQVASDFLISKEEITQLTEEQKSFVLVLQETINRDESISNDQVNLTKSFFDPNFLDEKGWMSLGFSAKQAQVILKYKHSLGGFSDVKELQSCFVISESKFKELKPYIVLPKKQKTYTKQTNRHVKESSYKSHILDDFDPNILNKKEWMKLGFTSKQVNVIIKYKKMLGGRFETKEQIKKCFVISDEKYEQIKNHIIFSALIEEKVSDLEVQNDKINSCTVNDLVKKGINSKIAHKIINYRNALGGYYNWSQLNEIKINQDVKKLLVGIFILDKPLNKLNVNKEELYVLKKHPYIDQDFVDFLKNNRFSGVEFSSFQKLQNQYKKKQLNNLLERYLSY